jgi:C4-dicarboxylate-specific signal transduction histidine kinase
LAGDKGKKEGRGGWDGSVELFCKVSAVISHEFNNVLATMHEDVGLLHDYLAMAAKGRELDPDRLAKVAGRMGAQVEKGQEIMAAMNRFAHSGDEALAEIELNDTLRLIGYFFRRPAMAKGIGFELPIGGLEVKILTNPFRMEELIWRCLEFAANHISRGGCLVMEIKENGRGAQLEIGGLGLCTEDHLTAFEESGVSLLLSDLDARLKLTEDEQGIIIDVANQQGL